MNEPEIPGRSMAEIASAPLNAMNHGASGVETGTRLTIPNPAAVPARIVIHSTGRIPSRDRSSTAAEATINPKNRPYTSSGRVSISRGSGTTRVKNISAAKIPRASGTRSARSACSAACRYRRVSRRRTSAVSNARIASISRR